MFGVIEMGTLENFLLKCKERLCTRAQLEICLSTERTLNMYYTENTYKYVKEILEDYITKKEDGSIVPKTKCQILGVCNESCGRMNECFTRLY